MYGPGFKRMRRYLGAKALETLRQDVLTKQREALQRVREDIAEQDRETYKGYPVPKQRRRQKT